MSPETHIMDGGGKYGRLRRLRGDEVECNQVQVGEAFLANGGFKGPQVAIIRPGTYRINPFLFNVARRAATEVASGKVGVVTAQDGQPLPPKFIVAPQPEISPSAAHPSSRPHNFFQDGQAFLESGGFRGPQLDTLPPGRTPRVSRVVRRILPRMNRTIRT